MSLFLFFSSSATRISMAPATITAPAAVPTDAPTPLGIFFELLSPSFFSDFLVGACVGAAVGVCVGTFVAVVVLLTKPVVLHVLPVHVSTQVLYAVSAGLPFFLCIE